ncbi:MAG: HypC/HybG/HupF family hydrogenase formation chaperone [Chloroflexota bacterium]
MCIGFPGRVVAVDAGGATVEMDGRQRRAATLLVPDVAVDDWVFVAAGTIVDRLDPTEAEMVRATLSEAIALEAAETSVPAEEEGRHVVAS